jgi:GTP-binding protein HflX
LTGAKAFVASQFFATLDPLVRRLPLANGGGFLLTDTVGFLHDFPPQLAAAFRATLEELEEADLLLHVADGSNPQCLKQIASVQEILADLKVDEKPIILAINKTDIIPPDVKKELKQTFPNAVFVSAKTGYGLEELKQKLQNTLSRGSPKRQNLNQAEID